MDARAYRILITGIVQGVGFRPHVYRLAQACGVRGWVLNSSAGVVIEAEASRPALDEFARQLVEQAPPLAVIHACQVQEIEWVGHRSFTIRHSQTETEKTVMIPPDIAVCADCRHEVTDPGDRRYRYPFTNCTNCGPRFTIIRDVPYDRAQTTMAPFPMCPQCQREYDDPLHRRFHAQPNACPQCGPRVTLCDARGRPVAAEAVDLLRRGAILAVKGLGGFHLAADATNRAAVEELRRRKRREAKPFAVMARDMEAVRRYCRVTPAEEAWLASPQAPIVILPRRPDSPLPDDAIHPGLPTLGVMLPYTPLHFLLFAPGLELLVMTSANISDEPLIIDNQEALTVLREVADYFLLHDRDIFNPCDDSVMQVTALGTPQFMRRARGFVPLGVRLPRAVRPVLAVGAEMKNTFCITRDEQAFLSQHWGDLNHLGNYRRWREAIPRFARMLSVEPEVIAHDLHPDYDSTRWARGQQAGVTLVGVQHHHAHMAAAMAENGLTGEVLGLVCDGTGWGPDGAAWGCEILAGGYQGYRRVGHLHYVPLPGGEVTVRRPYRMAFVYLHQLLGDEAAGAAARLLPDLDQQERQLLVKQLSGRLRGGQTSSCGRLFDAVSALLGVCTAVHYEGQAAAELEAAAAGERGQPSYAFALDHGDCGLLMDVRPMWRELLADVQRGAGVPVVAARFHRTLVEMFAAALGQARDLTGLQRVVLSGGVFHNQILLVELVQELERRGFAVYHHRQVPPGDGGIALGQAVIASEVSG